MFTSRNSEGSDHTFLKSGFGFVVDGDVDAVEVGHANLQQTEPALCSLRRKVRIGDSRQSEIVRFDCGGVRKRVLLVGSHLGHSLVKVLDKLIEGDLAIFIRVGRAAQSFDQTVGEDTVVEVVLLIGPLGLPCGRDESHTLRDLVHQVEVSLVRDL